MSILGRITSINAERGNLGTDKSVPYESVRIFSFVRLTFVILPFVRLPLVILPFVHLAWQVL
ncbi:MAG: hypothetical protein FWG87_13820 [Defluviitaleaceae bacterium]|nr:hypothetical protein [Defluviitaleaceae bacterium]